MVATAEKQLVFYSAAKGLRLIRKRDIRRATAFGHDDIVQPEVCVDFGEGSPGGLGRFLAAPGEDTMVDEDGETRDVVTWLRQHRDFGLLFFESGAEPGLLRPTDDEFTSAVMAALAAVDDDALHGLIAAERNSHNRQHLIDRAQEALEHLGGELHDVTSGDPES